MCVCIIVVFASFTWIAALEIVFSLLMIIFILILIIIIIIFIIFIIVTDIWVKKG